MYYRRFIDGFSSIDSPFKTLTKKNAKFELSEGYERDLQEFNDRLTSTPLLTLTEGKKEFLHYFDASPVSLGYVLMQYYKGIAYTSRQLKVHEQYTTHDLC